MASRHDTCAYKKQSDYFLSYARMVAIKADLEEIQRLNILDTNITDAQIAAINTSILDLRTHIKF